MAAVNKRQPPPGYPTGGEAKEKAPQVDNDKAQQTNGEDEDETDRGISARFMIGRSKPRSHERYPGPGFVPFDDYGPVLPPGPYNRPGHHKYGPVLPPAHAGHAPRHGFQPHVSYEVSEDDEDEDEDDYGGGHGHQPIPKAPQYYRHETYVVDQPPPPPPRRRPTYAPEGNYYVRDEYVRY